MLRIGRLAVRHALLRDPRRRLTNVLLGGALLVLITHVLGWVCTHNYSRKHVDIWNECHVWISSGVWTSDSTLLSEYVVVDWGPWAPEFLSGTRLRRPDPAPRLKAYVGFTASRMGLITSPMVPPPRWTRCRPDNIGSLVDAGAQFREFGIGWPWVDFTWTQIDSDSKPSPSGASTLNGPRTRPVALITNLLVGCLCFAGARLVSKGFRARALAVRIHRLRHCPYCGYSRRAARTAVCPECGNAHPAIPSTPE